MLNLIGVLFAFAVVIFLIRKKFNFGLSLIIGSLILGLFSLLDIDIIEIPKAFSKAIIYNFETKEFDTSTIELAALMTFIYMLAKLMQETGAITKLIDSFRPFFSKGGTLGVIPALYGLMPVTGGALFSAPLVDEEGDKYKLNKNQKNYLNVWFRHIWFPIYPISSAMILICSVEFSNIEISTLILANIPAFLAAIIIGLLFLKKFIKVNPGEIKENHKNKDLSGFKFLLPPIIPLLAYVVLLVFGVSQIRSFLIGVIISLFVLYFLTKTPYEKFMQLFKKSFTLKFALAIFGIMIFREMIAVSGVDKVIADLITLSNIPTISMVVLIPLILGLLTGYNLGAVALSYPIVQPFFPTPIAPVALLGFTSLIFISSLVGYLISPIHLCNVLSSDYLKTDTTRMYKMYVPSALVILAVQIVFVVLIINVL